MVPWQLLGQILREAGVLARQTLDAFVRAAYPCATQELG
jgi:hypothetical protein